MKYELNQLMLDVDGKLNEKRLVKKLYFIDKFLHFENLKINKSRTKHGWHIRISFNSIVELNDSDIVFLQSVLGDDWKRCMFNWLRVRSGCKKWNALFKKKYDSEMREISREK